MILISYPYAAPPVRLQERADDGGIRLRLTWQGSPNYTVDTDPRTGLSSAGARLLELAPGVRGQIIGGAVPTILGALADFTGMPAADIVQAHTAAESALRSQLAELLALLKKARKIIRASSSRNPVKDWDQRATAAVAKELRRAAE